MILLLGNVQKKEIKSIIITTYGVLKGEQK
jgi:hypothetical protein